MPCEKERAAGSGGGRGRESRQDTGTRCPADGRLFGAVTKDGHRPASRIPFTAETQNADDEQETKCIDYRRRALSMRLGRRAGGERRGLSLIRLRTRSCYSAPLRPQVLT